MTLKKGIVLSQRLAKKQKDVRYTGKYGAIVNKVMETKEGITNLNQKREVAELHGMVQDLAEGGIYKNELRELADKLAHGHEAKYISHKEGRAIAKVLKEKFYPGLKKYKSSYPSSSKDTGAGRQSSFTRYKPKKVSARATSSPAQGVASLTPTNMATIMNRLRENGEESSKNDGNNQSNGRFSKALEAMRKNKRG